MLVLNNVEHRPRHLLSWCLPPALVQVSLLPKWSPSPCPPDFKNHYLRASTAGFQFWSCQISQSRGLRQVPVSLGLIFLRCKMKCSQVLGEEGPLAAPLDGDNPGWLSPNTNNSQMQKVQMRTPSVLPCPLCHIQSLPGTSCALMMSPGPGSHGWL